MNDAKEGANMEIGRRIFFDRGTGNVLVDTGELQGAVSATTIDEDIIVYTELSKRNRETFDFIDLDYGQFAQDFEESHGNYRVNPETKVIEFVFPVPGEPEAPPSYQQPLSMEVESLKQENTLLKAQNQALTERADFIEDVVAEMAVQVYQ